MYFQINTALTKYLNLTGNQNQQWIVTTHQLMRIDQKLIFFRNTVKTSGKQENIIKHMNVKDICKKAHNKTLHISG
jgi:hypothetical protein